MGVPDFSRAVTISPSTGKRLQRIIKRDEQRPYNEVGDARGFNEQPQLFQLQITSTTTTDGRYPASLYQNIGGTQTLLGTAGDHWLETPNGETLATSKYYWAKLTGVRTSDSKLIYETVAAPSTFYGGIYVLDTDVTVASGVNQRLVFDQIVYQTYPLSFPLTTGIITLVLIGPWLMTANCRWMNLSGGAENGTYTLGFDFTPSLNGIINTTSNTAAGVGIHTVDYQNVSTFIYNDNAVRTVSLGALQTNTTDRTIVEAMISLHFMG